MANDISFDVVSDFDRQELVNAIDQLVRGSRGNVEGDQCDHGRNQVHSRLRGVRQEAN